MASPQPHGAGGDASSAGSRVPSTAAPSGRCPSPAGTAEPVSQDCLGCRVTGCLFGLGGAAYLGSSLVLADKPPVGAHRYGVIAAAGAMFVFGMYRAFG